MTSRARGAAPGPDFKPRGQQAMDLTTLSQLAIGGLTIGCVYSLVGLGFALTLRATDLINFAQGEMVMLGAFLGLTLVWIWPLPFYLVFTITVVLTGFFGVLMERLILRPIIKKKAPLLNLLIATLGVSITLQALAILVWGREPLPYPEIFGQQPLRFLGLAVLPLNLWILGLGLLTMAGLQFFFQKTMTGISWRAASLDPATAALYGVNPRRNVALTFGLSAALGGGAGVLIAPLFFASFGLGHSILAKTFAAAALGGFGVVGTMLGGLLLGVIETLAAGLISSEYKNVIMYAILLAILMFFFRPRLPAGRSITEGPKVAAGRAVRLLGADSPRAAKLLVWGLGDLWVLPPLQGEIYTLRILNWHDLRVGPWACDHRGLHASSLRSRRLLRGGAYTRRAGRQPGLPFWLSLAGVAAGRLGWLCAPFCSFRPFLAMGPWPARSSSS